MSASGKIRVGLIGLNAPYTGVVTGASWAAKAHLPYLKTSSKYELVALQNTSVERAQKAIQEYGLDPQKVKAYGTPEDIANDPNVDLVVSSIRVDRHGGSVVPSIKAGKDVFVEWPLEANYSLAKELADLVKKHKVRSAVGIQGSYEPVVKKIKSSIAAGEIGRVLSSTVVARTYGYPTLPSYISYFTERKIGGNHFTIAFGHSLEFITAALGEVSSHKSLLVNQFPEVDIVDPITREVIEKGRKNDVPTQIIFDAILESNVVLTYKLNNSPTIPPGGKAGKSGFPALDWRIFGTKGELRITTYETWSLNTGDATIKFEGFQVGDDGIKEIDIGQHEFEDLPLAARNIASLYEAFAEGVDEKEEKKKWYPDFGHALKRHGLLDQLYKENGFN
ncbi:putative oxidoreductase [Xylogone sp. PMI_703]|nr:putative oxidoreductase [Xylogone sp. PMI_703]